MFVEVKWTGKQIAYILCIYNLYEDIFQNKQFSGSWRKGNTLILIWTYFQLYNEQNWNKMLLSKVAIRNKMLHSKLATDQNMSSKIGTELW